MPQHGTVSPLRLDRIASAEDAEAVQTAAVEAYDGLRRGYAIHATTALSQRLLCCHEPFFGPLLDSDLTLSGNFCRLPYGVLGAGCALACALGVSYPLDGGEISCETASRAVAGCWLAVEVLGRRVPGSVPLNAFTATADFGLEVVHVHGPFVEHWDSLDLASARGLSDSMAIRWPAAALATSSGIRWKPSSGWPGFSRLVARNSTRGTLCRPEPAPVSSRSCQGRSSRPSLTGLGR